MRIGLKITFLSDWQVGSGLGDGHRADSCLVRDDQGLPFLPGRAVKGALREGAHRLGFCRADLAKAEALIFGSHCQTQDGAKSFNQPGRLTVSQGRLPGDIIDVILAADPGQRRLLVGDLTTIRVQTAIEKGTAKGGSLRSLECGLAGLFFQSQLRVDDLSDLPGESWLRQYFQAVCAMVKSLGANRSRGLGRCRLEIDGSVANVSLPQALDLTLRGGI
ncbi:MAG: RAMP superfamily CRISPR-associated protein [Candidatus Adiutrix sp.]|jgi:CRISPR/Cas system CSM-associated protein Csm3 (group 7 of RAMP superfamily)|nr:RAMP superfamily CRISPR-associated protein [Candidatus Adiutrix sp.]